MQYGDFLLKPEEAMDIWIKELLVLSFKFFNFMSHGVEDQDLEIKGYIPIVEILCRLFLHHYVYN